MSRAGRTAEGRRAAKGILRRRLQRWLFAPGALHPSDPTAAAPSVGEPTHLALSTRWSAGGAEAAEHAGVREANSACGRVHGPALGQQLVGLFQAEQLLVP